MNLRRTAAIITMQNTARGFLHPVSKTDQLLARGTALQVFKNLCVAGMRTILKSKIGN